jgi:hypothetical protein
LKSLDYRFRGNDRKIQSLTFYDAAILQAQIFQTFIFLTIPAASSLTFLRSSSLGNPRISPSLPNVLASSDP